MLQRMLAVCFSRIIIGDAMSLDPLSQEARQFVDQYIHSVEQLEIFLALAESREAITSHAILQRIQSSEKSILSCLKTLLKDGLLTTEKEERYRFSDQFPQLPGIASELGKAYRERHVTVIEMIYRKPSGPIQNFADAFRLRKDK
jgi:hypothetical protein